MCLLYKSHSKKNHFGDYQRVGMRVRHPPVHEPLCFLANFKLVGSLKICN